MRFDRTAWAKPDSAYKVAEMGAKFCELAKKINGTDIKFYVRVYGDLNQFMWSWERETMDEEVEMMAKLRASEEWRKLVTEFTPHVIETKGPTDSVWSPIGLK